MKMSNGASFGKQDKYKDCSVSKSGLFGWIEMISDVENRNSLAISWK